jgi:hypothetical protein
MVALWRPLLRVIKDFATVLRCDNANPKAVFTMLHCGECRFEMKPYLRAPALLQFFDTAFRRSEQPR